MKEQNIEQLLRSKLSGFEADVNPNAWTNILRGLQSPVPTSEVAGNAASAGKTMGLWGYAGLFVAVSAVVITAWVYNSNEKSSDEIAAVTPSVPALISESQNSFEPVVLSEVSPAAVKNSTAEKQTPGNSNKQELIPVVVQEKKEAAPSEINNNDNTPSAVAPAEPKNLESPSTEKPAEPNPIATENNSEDSENAVPVTADNSQPIENDFILLTDPFENNAPREQESRSDFTFYIPTVFSPNGDRQNDDFKPMGLNFKDYEVVIYDGNSNVIFRSKDIEHKWDGKLKDGTLAPAGNYACVISVKDLNNVEHPYRGQLLLKR